MYRITKVLNHNTVLAVKDKSAREYLIVGKGVGFGKKITPIRVTDKNGLENKVFGKKIWKKNSFAMQKRFFRNA